MKITVKQIMKHQASIYMYVYVHIYTHTRTHIYMYTIILRGTLNC